MSQWLQRCVLPRGRAHVMSLVVPLLLLVACGDDCKKKDFTQTAYKIVKTYAGPAFIKASLEEARRPALQRFHDATAGAESRADLLAAWQAEADLNAMGADWLTRKIFARAEADGDWDKTATASIDEKSSFVKATREALAASLQGGG